MGANAQTAVPAFTAGQVLTAAQQTQINTGIPVFADTTARDAAFGGTGEKVLAEGQFAYIEASNATQYYDGAAWQTVGGGLTLIKTQTIGTAVSSVTVTNAFSSSYENYLITVSGGVGSFDGGMDLTLGAAVTNYRYSVNYMAYNSNTVNGLSNNSTTSWILAVEFSSTGMNGIINLFEPFATRNTIAHWTSVRAASNGENVQGRGMLNDTTSYTDFKLTCNGGNVTGGTIRVYGYQNS